MLKQQPAISTAYPDVVQAIDKFFPVLVLMNLLKELSGIFKRNILITLVPANH